MKRGAILVLAMLALAGCGKKENASVDPNAVFDKGVSNLEWAMLNQDRPRFEALLAAGADVRHADDTGDTVMLYAAKANDPAYLDILLARHVDPNQANALSGRTPLMVALLGERHVQFHALLAAKANVNLADHAGDTALHVAAQINENQAVRELLEAGADPLARNKQGATFQRYLNMTPAKVMSEDARIQKQAVLNWLVAHRIPIEP